MTVRAYLRVSTAEQANEGHSLDTQKARLSAYHTMKGWADAPVFYVEEGVSGSVPFADRPQGGRLLADLVSGDVLLAVKLDRAFRSAADALTMLDRLRAAGVDLHLLDIGDTSGSVGRLIFSILAAVAEMERERISERIRETKQNMRATGKHHGGMRPFGFDVVDGRQVARPEEQLAIVRMHEMRDAGASYGQIARSLSASHGVDLWPRQVGRILAREAAPHG